MITKSISGYDGWKSYRDSRGHRHNPHGPAFIGTTEISYWINHNKHNIVGCAMILTDESNRYYIHGHRIC